MLLFCSLKLSHSGSTVWYYRKYYCYIHYTVNIGSQVLTHNLVVFDSATRPDAYVERSER